VDSIRLSVPRSVILALMKPFDYNLTSSPGLILKPSNLSIGHYLKNFNTGPANWIRRSRFRFVSAGVSLFITGYREYFRTPS